MTNAYPVTKQLKLWLYRLQEVHQLQEFKIARVCWFRHFAGVHV
jgi:hypothetical protein